MSCSDPDIENKSAYADLLCSEDSNCRPVRNEDCLNALKECRQSRCNPPADETQSEEDCIVAFCVPDGQTLENLCPDVGGSDEAGCTGYVLPGDCLTFRKPYSYGEGELPIGRYDCYRDDGKKFVDAWRFALRKDAPEDPEGCFSCYEEVFLSIGGIEDQFRVEQDVSRVPGIAPEDVITSSPDRTRAFGPAIDSSVVELGLIPRGETLGLDACVYLPGLDFSTTGPTLATGLKLLLKKVDFGNIQLGGARLCINGDLSLVDAGDFKNMPNEARQCFGPNGPAIASSGGIRPCIVWADELSSLWLGDIRLEPGVDIDFTLAGIYLGYVPIIAFAALDEALGVDISVGSYGLEMKGLVTGLLRSMIVEEVEGQLGLKEAMPKWSLVV